MSNLLNEDIVSQIREVFEKMDQPVHVLFFGAAQNCEYCGEARQLAEEVIALSDKLSLDVHDLDADAELARAYNMDKAPGMALTYKDGGQIVDLGIRYAGIPSGHEFSSFIQDILLASGRDSGLSAATRAFLKSLTAPVSLQVFVTPT